MKHQNKDFLSEAIADYEAMKQEEQGSLLVQILEDQPILMGFITNLADDFEDSEHEALVTATVVLINAFVSAGIPVSMVPHQMLDEVIRERLELYEGEKRAVDETIDIERLTDSPKVFEDLRNYALFKSKLAADNYERRESFAIALDTIMAIVERSAAAEVKPEDEA
jgi:hypothetical protein